MTTSIYVLSTTPGAPDGGTLWLKICGNRDPFVTVDYNGYRSTGRWSWVERKLCFRVTAWSKGAYGLSSYVVGWHKTLDKAVAAANSYVAEEVA